MLDRLRDHLRWTFLATLAFAAALAVVGLPLNTDAAPHGVLDLELARTGARIAEILASWRAAHAMTAAWVVQVLDCGFPIAYAAFGAGLAQRWAGRLARPAAALFVASGALDLLVENPLLDVMMAGTPSDALAFASSTAALLKLGCLGLGLLAVPVGRAAG